MPAQALMNKAKYVNGTIADGKWTKILLTDRERDIFEHLSQHSSVHKFKDIADVDFTDVDFLDAIERAYDILEEDAKRLPVDGRPSAIARAQIECYDRFFENIFGEGVCNQMFDSMSLERRLDAVEQLAEFRMERHDLR